MATVTYQLSKKDILEYTQHTSWSNDNVKGIRMIGFVISVPFVIIIWLLSKPYMPLQWMQSAMMIMLFILGTFLFPVLYKRWLFKQTLAAYQGNPELTAPMEMSLTDEGIATKTTLSKNERSWKTVDKLDETTNLIIVYLTDKSAYIIPKQSFHSVQEIDFFKNVLIKNIKLPPDNTISNHLIS